MNGRIAPIRRTRRWAGVLCVLGPLTLVPVWAQQEEEPAGGPDPGNRSHVYRDLELREEADAERRLEILRMRGEAARLTANTEELAAQAQNCKARRDAHLAGADVPLCPNDELGAEITDVSLDTRPVIQDVELLLDRFEDRMWSLEQRLIENSARPAPEPQKPFGGSRRGLVTAHAQLLLAGPARAIVRLSGGAQDVLYRLPFEARRDGPDCIRTVQPLHGIGSGTRICRAPEKQ